VQVHVIHAPWSQYTAVLRKLREVVFIDEQNVPRDIEWDGRDEDSDHLLAIDEIGRHLGCARLLPSGQIGRMAVLSDERGRGIGAQLLAAAVELGKERGFDRLFLHAQSHAEAFYRKAGFVPFGGEFSEAGIAHIAMEMKLPLAFPTQASSSKQNKPTVRSQNIRPQLSEPTPQPVLFEDQAGAELGLSRVLAAARRKLCILSPFLDHELFDVPERIEQISALARGAPRAEIRILILSSKLMVDRGHRLLELARRLDQKISIRVMDERPNADTSTFMCADLDGYWLMPSYEKYDGVSDLVNPVTTKRLTEAFERAWEKSREDPELRIVRI